MTLNTDSPIGPDQRLWRRYEFHWPAVVADLRGGATDAFVVDAGNGGLGLRGCPQFDVGQEVQITLSGLGTFKCRVVWRRDDRCGVAFLPLDGSLTSSDISLLAIAIENWGTSNPNPTTSALLHEANSFHVDTSRGAETPPSQTNNQHHELEALIHRMNDLSHELKLIADSLTQLQSTHAKGKTYDLLPVFPPVIS